MNATKAKKGHSGSCSSGADLKRGTSDKNSVCFSTTIDTRIASVWLGCCGFQETLDGAMDEMFRMDEIYAAFVGNASMFQNLRKVVNNITGLAWCLP